jgi:predicted heme/steroid binding protein
MLGLKKLFKRLPTIAELFHYNSREKYFYIDVENESYDEIDSIISRYL